MEKKKIGVGFIFLAVLLWVIYAFSTDNSDYHIYSAWYDYTGNHGLIHRFEPLFSLSLLLGNMFKLSYQQFLGFVSAVGLLLIYKRIYEYCEKPSLVLVLYFIYPFFLDIIQVRNFISLAIMIYSLKYLREYSKKNVIRFLILIILATLFHIASLFYLCFLLAYMDSYKKIIRYSCIISVVGLVVIILFPSFVNNMFMSFGNEDYIEGGTSAIKIIGYGIYSLSAIIVSLLYINSYQERDILNENYILKVIPMIIFSVMMIAVTSQGYRIFRNMSLIIYMAFTNEITCTREGKIMTNCSRLIMLVYVASFSIFFFFHHLFGESFERVIRPIIESNPLFDWIQ